MAGKLDRTIISDKRGLLISVVGPVVLLIFTLIDGTPGPNRYGRDLKDRVPAQ